MSAEPSSEIGGVPSYRLSELVAYAVKLGTTGFGGPVALVGYMHRDLVEQRKWISEDQYREGLALAQLAPGPLAAQLAIYLGYVHYRILGATLTVGFIGYLVSGLPGAVVAALATFLPCYLFTVIPAPYFSKYGKLAGVKAFVDGVTAAAIGTIAGAVVVLGERSIVDFATAVMALLTLVALLKLKKLPEPFLVAIAAVLGIVLYPILHP